MSDLIEKYVPDDYESVTGFSGTCNYISGNFFVKVGCGENEINATKKAAQKRISPLVVLYGQFDNIGYIVMQKLHKTLDVMYPYNVKYIIKAIDLYISLWKTTKIQQRDLKCNNIMLNEKGKVFLIDYGQSKTGEPLDLTSDDHKYQIFRQCNLLLNTLFFKGPIDFDTAQAFNDDKDFDRKSKEPNGIL